MAFWRRRDHEGYIGSYDPEHEMPDPEREPRDRYESEAYRHNARDSRYAYRWDPNRIESSQGVRDRWDRGANRDGRSSDRNWNAREPRSDYELGYQHGRRDAEIELYRREHSGPYDRDADREIDRGRNRAIDYDRDWRDRY